MTKKRLASFGVNHFGWVWGICILGCVFGMGLAVASILWDASRDEPETRDILECRRETSGLIRDLFWHSDDVRALHISEWAWGDLRPWQAGAFLGCRVVERGRCSFKDFGLCYRCRKILLPRFME